MQFLMHVVFLQEANYQLNRDAGVHLVADASACSVVRTFQCSDKAATGIPVLLQPLQITSCKAECLQMPVRIRYLRPSRMMHFVTSRNQQTGKLAHPDSALQSR